MQRVMRRSARMTLLWEWFLALWQHIEAQPLLYSRVLMLCWFITRIALFAGLIIGHSYCDPQFYNYAGKLAAGQWPYTASVPVEYPPIAMILILLPALPLLPFAGIAPRPDPAFVHITHIPSPDPVRYGAYGISFAFEMLLIDALTLWLIQRAARKYIATDPTGIRSGLCYILLIFLSGALLQKFDLVSGMLCLLALVALLGRRDGFAWSMLGVATLIKGFPLLLIPIFIGYYLYQAKQTRPWLAVREQARPLITGALSFAATIAGWTLLVIFYAGIGGVAHSILYQGSRGTEIESLYANVTLLIGWLPGVHLSTIFNPQDLSRIVKSSIDDAMSIVSVVLLAVSLMMVYGAYWFAVRRRQASRQRPFDHVNHIQLVGIGSAAVFLAFLLTFRALPAHYLLALTPIAVLLRLPGRSLQRYWLISLFGIAVVGQIVSKVWSALVLLQPGAVILLTIRNAAWIGAFVMLVVALWRWGEAAYRAQE